MKTPDEVLIQLGAPKCQNCYERVAVTYANMPMYRRKPYGLSSWKRLCSTCAKRLHLHIDEFMSLKILKEIGRK